MVDGLLDAAPKVGVQSLQVLTQPAYPIEQGKLG